MLLKNKGGDKMISFKEISILAVGVVGALITLTVGQVISAVSATQGASITTDIAATFDDGNASIDNYGENISSAWLSGMQSAATSQNTTYTTTNSLMIIAVLVGLLAAVGFELLTQKGE